MAICRECGEQAAFGNPLCKACLKKLSWLDRQLSANLIWLVILPLFCNCLALPLSIAGVIGCKDETAKSNARIMLVVSIIALVLAVLIRFSK